MQELEIKAEIREESGKKSCKAIRSAGRIPGIVYSKNTNVKFTVAPNDVKHLIYTPDFKVAVLQCGGKTYKCFLKDLQTHPVTDKVEHIDLQELVVGHKVKLKIPVRFTGTAVGQKAGGQLIQLVRQLNIKAKPEHLVDSITLDITELKLGFSIRVREIAEMTGVEILDAPGMPLASIVVPRALKSATTADEEGEGEGEETTETAEA